MTPAARRPLDRVLVDRGLAVDLDDARHRIEEGTVLVGGAPALSAARAVAAHEPVVVVERPRFVGRGGEKLDAAIEALGVEVAGRVALDVGASTGGFTDCLLARGATKVLAVDVGHGQLHERLVADDRVVALEGTNVRDLGTATATSLLGAPAAVVTADLSFTSVVPHCAHLVEVAADGATLLVLVKPQFEASRATASKGRGVIEDPDEWRASVTRCASALEAAAAGIMGVVASPILGAAGNAEFFVWARKGAGPRGSGDLARDVEAAIERAPRR